MSTHISIHVMCMYVHTFQKHTRESAPPEANQVPSWEVARDHTFMYSSERERREGGREEGRGEGGRERGREAGREGRKQGGREGGREERKQGGMEVGKEGRKQGGR